MPKREPTKCLIWTIANFSNLVGQHLIQRVMQFSTGRENKLQHSWFLELEPELSVTVLVSRMDFHFKQCTSENHRLCLESSKLLFSLERLSEALSFQLM